MPIIIKGPERPKGLIKNSSSVEIIGKRLNNLSLKGADSAENGNRCYLSMLNGHLVDEVVVYRVQNGSVNQTTLIGENLLSSVQNSEFESLNRLESVDQKALPLPGEPKIHMVDAMHYSAGGSSLRDVSKGILMKRIELSSVRTRLTKAGRSIAQDIGSRSLEESFTWSLKHATADELDLKSLLFTDEPVMPSKSPTKRAGNSQALSKKGTKVATSSHFKVPKLDNVEELAHSNIINKGSSRGATTKLTLSDDGIKSPSRNCSNVKKSAPKSDMKKQTGPALYSNENVPHQFSEEETARLLQSEDLYKKRLRSVMSEFVKSQGKIASMQHDFTNFKSAVESTCGNVAIQSRVFNDFRAKQRRGILTLCDDREFRRPELMRARMQRFDMRLFEDGSGHSTVGTVTQGWDKIGTHALHEMKRIELSNMTNAHWFSEYIAKLREYMHRTKLDPPLSCLRFLVVIKLMLSRSWAFNKELFYRILEETVKDKKDFKSMILHNTLSAVRAAIGVGSAEFLTYLRDRQIEPCPELLVAEADEIKFGSKYVDKGDRSLNTDAIRTKEVGSSASSSIAAVQAEANEGTVVHAIGNMPLLIPVKELSTTQADNALAEVVPAHGGTETSIEEASSMTNLALSITDEIRPPPAKTETTAMEFEAAVRPSAPRTGKNSRASFLRGKRLLSETTSLSAR